MLQSGFVESGRQGDSILAFLLTLDGFTEPYIENEVQTIFYNGDALDDSATALGGETATIALGAAMPGLAGAIMKKGSICGAFRKNRAIVDIEPSEDPVTVRVKLFNTVARERGPQLLKKGIQIDTKDLRHFLEMRPRLIEALAEISFGDRSVRPEELIDLLAPHQRIIIKARTND